MNQQLYHVLLFIRSKILKMMFDQSFVT